jgi:hypothetical protein
MFYESDTFKKFVIDAKAKIEEWQERGMKGVVFQTIYQI